MQTILDEVTVRIIVDQETFFKNLGARIAQLRKESGWSQAELGNRVGLSQQMIADYESGKKHHLPLCRVIVLADVFGVDLAELLLGQNGNAQKRGPLSKMERQIAQVRRLPKTKQRFVSELLDNVLAQAH